MKEKSMVVKLLSILVAVIMLAALFSGCGTVKDQDSGDSKSADSLKTGESSGNAEEASVERTPVKIKILSGGLTPESSVDDEIGKILKEKFNFEIEFVPFNESHYEKALMMLSANDWGDLDLVSTALDDVTKKYIAAGTLVKLDDFLDRMPDFKSYLADLIPYWRVFDSKEGNLYVWQGGPDQGQMTSEPLDICTRVDVLEACGWPQMDTTEDYVDFLKQAMEKVPESMGQKSIGMSFFWGESIGPLVSSYLPRHSGYQHFYKTTGLVDVDNNKIVPMASHPYFKEAMKFWNTLSREGLMDREAWTDGFGELTKKMEAGVPLTVHFAKFLIAGANAKLAAAGHPEVNYITTPIRLSIAKKEGKNVRYELYNMLRPDETVGILKQSKNIDRIIEVVNFMATEEMAIRAGWGEEGRDYNIIDGKRVPTAEFLSVVKSGEAGEILKQRGIGVRYGAIFPTRQSGMDKNGQAILYYNSTEFLMANASDTQKKAYQAYGWKDALSPWKENPNFKYAAFDITPYIVASGIDSDSNEAKTEEKIIQFMDKQIPLLVNAKSDSEFDMKYEEMVKRVESIGIQAVIDKYNEQLSNFQSKLDELKKK